MVGMPRNVGGQGVDEFEEIVVRTRAELRDLWHDERLDDARLLLTTAVDDFGPSPVFEVMAVRQEVRELDDRADAGTSALEHSRNQLGQRLEAAAEAAGDRADVLAESAVAAYEIEDRRLAAKLLARLPEGVGRRLDPNLLGPVLYVGGELLAEQGQRGQAEEQFRIAIEYDPTLVNAYAGLAAVLVHRGNLQGAEDVIAMGLRQAPGDVGLRELEDDLAEIPAELRRALRGRSAPEAPGPSDRCWCGSGRAVADCHGRD